MKEDTYLEAAYEERYEMDDDFSDMFEDTFEDFEDDFPEDDFPMELEYDDWREDHIDYSDYDEF